ncbi:tail assembly protein [Pseudomonas poae]|jgi:predicted phage tail protein|uniref:tail assembly protein n=1 Tax=Pseudomonas poae TaxID=200451 RepID=UPI001D0C405D|nr:tail assembly protein [Pseudomonas poae]
MAALAINYQPMTTILLYGQLRQFGRSFRMAVKSPAEAIKALCVQIPGFERFLSNAKSRGIEFAVFRGRTNLAEKELGFAGGGDIRIAPIITGGTFGAGAPFGSALIMMGGSMVLGGVIQMLSPQAGGLKTSAAPENTPGYICGAALLDPIRQLHDGGFQGQLVFVEFGE